ncbi:nucleotidyltransferase domain-containing protein [Candidatus Woesearchaeota archaeon]|nr:nucleotidyltransferase domain-containing protein [Candidatus Woesearchaeota archaeon]
MLTQENVIIEPFIRKPWKALTFGEVKTRSNNKSDNYVHTTLKKLVKEEILKEQKIGNNIVYSINQAIFALNTIGFIAEFKAHQAKHLPHKNIQQIIGKINRPYYTFIITGSYAKNKQKETSGVDIVVICDDQQSPNAVLSQIKLESELMVPEFHPYVFTQVQFYEMLINKEENYGKEIARNNLIIAGGREYYAILLEAVKHGFNG